MTYDSIPLPSFSFSDEPERIAQIVFDDFFSSDYQVHYYLKTVKEYIQNKLYEQVGEDDRIIFLSFLINKISIKLLELPQPRNDWEKTEQERGVKSTYRSVLHWLYQLIRQEGISVPSDLFNEGDYEKAQSILSNIDNIIEQLKIENPDNAEDLELVKEEVKKTTKFLWLGKEKWTELLIGVIMKVLFEKGILPISGKIFTAITSIFPNLLK